jgi:hypothetical protein
MLFAPFPRRRGVPRADTDFPIPQHFVPPPSTLSPKAVEVEV